MKEKWCLITGGSKGIGYELAKLFAKNKYNLILVARSEERLKLVKEEIEKSDNVKVIIRSLNLLKDDSVKEIRSELVKRKITVDVLVNDAGFGATGDFIHDNIRRDIDMIRLNTEILTEMTYLFLKEMLERGTGKILNVASVAGFMPGPLSAVYYATKSYVLHFSVGVAEEIRGRGVTISVLCPGPTKTDFAKTADMDKSKIMRWLAAPAKDVAKAAYNGMMRGKLLIIPGFLNRLMVASTKITPLRILVKVVKFVMLP